MWMIPSPPSPPTIDDEPPAVVANEVTGTTVAPIALAPRTTLTADEEEAIVEIPGPDEMRRLLRSLREVSDRELISRLDVATLYEGHAIREVLRGRGISAELLELISQTELQQADERRAMLGRLGALPAAHSRHLLRWFVADRDADVRLKALTLLATSGDPKLSEIARVRAVEETDPRVSALAARIVKEYR
jgi:hypothetical protein